VEDAACEVRQISLAHWKSINARGNVWVVATRQYKALPVWIALNFELANSMVIDSENAEFILSTK
jgi:DNA-binding transcriptional regulator LsrR (DeoR family)